MPESLEISLGVPIDYKQGRGRSPSHFTMRWMWNFETREVKQKISSNFRLEKHTEIAFPIGPWSQLASRLDPLFMRRSIYSDLACRIVIEVDNLTVAGRREADLSQQDRDHAAFLLLLMFIKIGKRDNTDCDALEITIDSEEYERYKRGSTNPPRTELSSFPHSAEHGQYASLHTNETRVIIKNGKGQVTTWGWNADSYKLRPLGNSPLSEQITEGETVTNPENFLVVEACRRLDPKFLLRHEKTDKYENGYDIASLKKLADEIADRFPLDFLSDLERSELEVLLLRTFFKLLFGDPKTFHPIPLLETRKLLFVSVDNFGERISIQPMFEVKAPSTKT